MLRGVSKLIFLVNDHVIVSHRNEKAFLQLALLPGVIKSDISLASLMPSEKVTFFRFQFFVFVLKEYQMARICEIV